MIPEPLAQFPKICWTGETAVCSQMLTPRWVTAHSIFLVMDCSHKTAPIPSDIPSVFDALDQGIFGIFFFLWHFSSHWVWRDLLPPHFLDALGAAWRTLNCSGMLLKKQVVSPALLFWPLHSSLAVFIFGPPHVRWHWLDPKCYTSKQGGYATPESPWCLQSLPLPPHTHTQHWEFQCTKLSSALDLYFQGKITRHWKTQEAS